MNRIRKHDPMDIVDSLSELVSEGTDCDPGKELLEAQKSIGDKKLQLIAESLKAARDHALCEKQALPLSNPPGEDAAALEGDGSSHDISSKSNPMDFVSPLEENGVCNADQMHQDPCHQPGDPFMPSGHAADQALCEKPSQAALARGQLQHHSTRDLMLQTSWS